VKPVLWVPKDRAESRGKRVRKALRASLGHKALKDCRAFKEARGRLARLAQREIPAAASQYLEVTQVLKT
jgi:hypothetical protein